MCYNFKLSYDSKFLGGGEAKMRELLKLGMGRAAKARVGLEKGGN